VNTYGQMYLNVAPVLQRERSNGSAPVGALLRERSRAGARKSAP